MKAEPGLNDGEIALRFTAPGNDDRSVLRPLNGEYLVQYCPVSEGGSPEATWGIDKAQRAFAIRDVNYGHPDRVIVALLGDTQFGFPKGSAEPAVKAIRPTMADLAGLEHDFLAILGDIVQTDRFWGYHHREVIAKATRPIYHIAGNAEKYYGLDRFAKETGCSPSGYRVYVRGIRFIFLSVTAVSGHKTHICHVGEEQMEWLKAELARDRKSSTAVFFHAPLADTTIGSERVREVEMFMHESEDMARLLAENPNVLHFGNGHLHRAYGPTAGPKQFGPYFVRGNVLHVSVGRAPHTCVVEFSRDGITVRVRDNRKKGWKPGWGIKHSLPTTAEPKQLEAQTLAVSGLEPGARYALRLWTEDDAGNVSAASNLVSAIARKLPQAAPGSPEELEAGTSANGVTFSALYRDVNVRDRATHYEIEMERRILRVVDDFGDGDHSGWIFRNMGDLRETDGVLRSRATSNDPHMVTKLDPPADGSVFDTVAVRLRATGNPRRADVYWANQEKRISRHLKMGFGPEEDGELHTYELPVGTHKEWQGKTIRELRLDPGCVAELALEIDHIVLKSRPGRGEMVWRPGPQQLSPVLQGRRAGSLPYTGPRLSDGAPHFWRIRFRDNHGATGPWSAWTPFTSVARTASSRGASSAR